MHLHKDQDLFRQLIDETAKKFNIQNAAIVEKDYFVSLYLKMLIQQDNQFVFKGGTSLSKCFKVIQRFSEDIDINYTYPITGPKKTKVRELVKTVSDALGFDNLNYEDTKSRFTFNRYEIDYHSAFPQSVGIKPNIILETAFQTESFPVETRSAASLIYDYLKEIDRDDIIEIFELQPFELTVQSLVRTFIDKVFAICDYLLSSKVKEHSRHIYDLYKLFPVVSSYDNLEDLIKEVRLARKSNKYCLSAQDNQDISLLLNEIIGTQIYKDDYSDITEKIIYEPCAYEEASSVLEKIVELNVF